MSAFLATLALALLAGLCFALGTSLLVAIGWPALRRILARAHPAIRAQLTFALSVAPGFVPLWLIALCLAPGMASLLGWHEDHCLTHRAHLHLCFTHPRAALTTPLAVVLGVAGGGLLASLGWGTWRLARWRKQIEALRVAAAETLAPGVRLIPSEQPFSLTLGLGRPEIWVSSALVDALPKPQLDVVLAHERAHARRRDSLRRVAAHALSLPLWPGLRRELLTELAVSSEQACDEAAGRELGDRLSVAETILAVERLLADVPPPRHSGPLLAFGGNAVPQRVAGLLADAPAQASRALAALIVGGAIAAGWLFDGALHHTTEHLLNLLLHVL